MLNSESHSVETFSEIVTTLLMATEELRRTLDTVVNAITSSDNHDLSNKNSIRTDYVVEWQQDIEGLLHHLDRLARLRDDGAVDSNGNDLLMDMFAHCEAKVIAVTQQAMNVSLKLTEPQEDDADLDAIDDVVSIDVLLRDGQAAIARIVEVNLVLLENERLREELRKQEASFRGSKKPLPLSSQEDTGRQDSTAIINSYVAYQRKVLRMRVKPAIARLVQERQSGSMSQDSAKLSLYASAHVNRDFGDEHDVDDDPKLHLPTLQQHHAPVLSEVLGQAAALIHPLLVWQANLPVLGEDENEHIPSDGLSVVRALRTICRESVKTLDEQAQTLAKTVSDWFWDDRPIESWMKRSTAEETIERYELAVLDGLVDELAFGCQLLARYQTLIQSFSAKAYGDVIHKELLPEWTWKYATLERFLSLQQWKSAMSAAAPVHTVIGTDIQVPSVVEDAQYLSTRALERAASTQSQQAIGTVAHSVSRDIWSIDIEGGVHQALMEKVGCWAEPKAVTESKQSNNSSQTLSRNSFATSLLSALDEDLHVSPPFAPSSMNQHLFGNKASRGGTSSATSSGNFLSAFGIGNGGGDKLQELQMNADFCVLNGFHAASGACHSLVTFLDSLLLPIDEEVPQLSKQNNTTMAMIQLAREELFRYAESYQKLLRMRIQENLEVWCGAGADDPSGIQKTLSLHHLHHFFKCESYELDATSFTIAESDDRLEASLMQHLKECRYLTQMSGKCESDVILTIGEHIVFAVVELILTVLWNTDKKFTDWGSLLLSKQIRLLQGFVSDCLTTKWTGNAPPNLIQNWERLSQVSTVLQLEKPADWLIYCESSLLSPDEVQRTLSLRIDFSVDAIQAVVAQISNRKDPL